MKHLPITDPLNIEFKARKVRQREIKISLVSIIIFCSMLTYTIVPIYKHLHGYPYLETTAWLCNKIFIIMTVMFIVIDFLIGLLYSWSKKLYKAICAYHEKFRTPLQDGMTPQQGHALLRQKRQLKRSYLRMRFSLIQWTALGTISCALWYTLSKQYWVPEESKESILAYFFKTPQHWGFVCIMLYNFLTHTAWWQNKLNKNS